MAPKSKVTSQVSVKKPAALPTDQKIPRLLVLFVVKDIEDKQEQALSLLAAGFDASEISEMLKVNKNYAHAAAHRKKQTEANR